MTEHAGTRKPSFEEDLDSPPPPTGVHLRTEGIALGREEVTGVCTGRCVP